MRATTKLSGKGQVVIPAAVRRALGLSAGQTLRITRTENGVLLTPLLQKSGRTTEELLAEMRKIYTHEGPPATIEEMDRAIERMFAERSRGDI
jgi:AbrB family looped-hinge helix DNA binding protein